MRLGQRFGPIEVHEAATELLSGLAHTAATAIKPGFRADTSYRKTPAALGVSGLYSAHHSSYG